MMYIFNIYFHSAFTNSSMDPPQAYWNNYSHRWIYDSLVGRAKEGKDTGLVDKLIKYSDCFIRVMTALLEYFDLYTKSDFLAPVS